MSLLSALVVLFWKAETWISSLVCSFILEDFQKFHIDVSLVSEHAQCVLPASVVISNVRTGSRTILHMNRCVFVCVCVFITSSCRCDLHAGSAPLAFGLVCLRFYERVWSHDWSVLLVSSRRTSCRAPSTSLQWSGRSKVKLRARVVWSAQPPDLELWFCTTRKTSLPLARAPQPSLKTSEQRFKGFSGSCWLDARAAVWPHLIWSWSDAILGLRNPALNEPRALESSFKTIIWPDCDRANLWCRQLRLHKTPTDSWRQIPKENKWKMNLCCLIDALLDQPPIIVWQHWGTDFDFDAD